ncbi:hypothetical protein Calab_2600 [Caldithrix abyssi DSM 13497]|uniref:Uncharacterized protein n=1 Tax=Caldithrix abyssi DSM 13497 TaxID=880073 RepID=H1XP95_CALAY|nr:hypothetical protein Calab_2600 [Caldithrix abyssi DSM 13497]
MTASATLGSSHSRASGNPFHSSTSFPRKRESLPLFHVIPAQAGILFKMQRIPALATLGRNDTRQSFPRKRESLPPFHVIPAKAGILFIIQGFRLSLRSAGMTPDSHSRESGNPFPPSHVIPAQAGIPFIMQRIPALAALGRNDLQILLHLFPQFFTVPPAVNRSVRPESSIQTSPIFFEKILKKNLKNKST